MKVALGFDHAGIKLKSALIKFLESSGYEYEDYGTYSEDSCNYAVYAERASEAVINKTCDTAILICGTGIGMSITANKITGIRCGLCHDVFTAEATRKHNDANVLAIGARVVDENTMKDIVKAFLTTEFEGGRHLERIEKIGEIERKYSK